MLLADRTCFVRLPWQLAVGTLKRKRLIVSAIHNMFLHGYLIYIWSDCLGRLNFEQQRRYPRVTYHDVYCLGVLLNNLGPSGPP